MSRQFMSAAEAGAYIFVIGFLASLGIVGWQSYQWLKAGEWPALSVLDALAKFAGPGDFLVWIWNPQQWIGVHKALAWLPLSGACLGLGVLILWLCLAGEK